MLTPTNKTYVKHRSRANYSRPAPVLKRYKNSDFFKLKILEISVLASQKWQNSSSTLDPATIGNPCRCKGFRISGDTGGTKTGQYNSSFPMRKKHRKE